jgi:succinate-semialdehyde dehydrogenase/glutarate-semialdehyde dehydrogenase
VKRENMTTQSLDALADRDLLRTELFIDGAWSAAASASTLDVVNPADGALIASVARGDSGDADRAVTAANAAFSQWSATTALERAAVLRRWFELVVEHVDDLALILTAEQGKPLAEARGEILYGAAFLEWFAEEGKRVYGEVIPTNKHGRRLMVLRQPVGVCAAITPWNFPMAMITRKAGPALAAGCTMVLKPASATPLSALAIAELGRRAGLPPGVVNVVPGGAREVGTVLATHPLVRKVTFTGSTDVGKELMAQGAATMKRMSLELGGNAPVIIFDDADLDVAVQGTIDSKFRNSGQTCVCANRVLVQDGVYDEFVQRLAKATAQLTVGSGFDVGVQQGPLIDEAAVAKVEEHIADAVEGGASVITGGKRHQLGGTFFEPTVLADVTKEMKVAREETFGPLAPVFRFHTEREAVELANATEFGLAAYFFTRSNGRVWRMSEALQFGVVGVNTGLISYEGAPFGGMKESGVGREGSRHAMDDFTELKYVCVDGVSERE